MEKKDTQHSSANQELRLKRTNKVLIAIIVLLSIVLGITFWQFFELRKDMSERGTEIELLNNERGELEEELTDMLNELDSMETDNDSMKMELSNRKNEIEELLAKVKDKDFAIYKLKKETTTLRTIMKGYVVTIDSLNTLNVGLRKENQEVKTTLNQERRRSKELVKSNENLSSKVALASRLDVADVEVFGVRVRRDMTGKETDRARKTDKIRVCFTLRENKVAKVEKKTLYLQIIAPDGQFLLSEDGEEGKFEFNGKNSYYTDKMVVSYDQSAQKLCLDWQKPDDNYVVLAGSYNIALFAEDYEMASTTHSLK
ncbi:MAG: hypothetical protein CMO34_06955 [Verrucomicrobia bacterium]|nr:hypothetical protein [Verrucomicrobiota bacterium]|tara:strand:+ start:1140 stop:2081 length:942 start_codon:yes stop_codon:yes gene_type:complete